MARDLERRIKRLEDIAKSKGTPAGGKSVREMMNLKPLQEAMERDRERTGKPGPDLSGIPDTTQGEMNISRLRAVIEWDQMNN